MFYYLKYQEHILGVLDIKGNSSFITKGILYADNAIYLPLSLQILVLNKEKYFKQKSTDTELLLNYDGCSKVNEWLKDREIPLDRDNLSSELTSQRKEKMVSLYKDKLSYVEERQIAEKEKIQ
jgi:hypothetical protein